MFVKKNNTLKQIIIILIIKNFIYIFFYTSIFIIISKIVNLGYMKNINLYNQEKTKLDIIKIIKYLIILNKLFFYTN